MAERADLIPSREQIEAAATALKGVVVETPLIAAEAIAREVGAESVHLKLESLQKTGSFKFRGAYWRCARLTAEERAAGVVAYSSGNFAQGLAAAAQVLGVPATIVMPIDAPEAKRRKTEAFGATVVQTDHGDRSREEVASEKARALAAERGMTLLHPFDDPAVIAGHASVAREIVSALAAAGSGPADTVLCCVGGGGLLAGVALGLKAWSPETELIPVEPQGYDSFGQSLEQGGVTRLTGGGATICDALQATAPGAAPFACAVAAGVTRHLVVTDAIVRKAMRLAFESCKIVLEPSGAVGLAGLLSRPELFAGRRAVVMATGGNIELSRFGTIAGDEAA